MSAPKKKAIIYVTYDSRISRPHNREAQSWAEIELKKGQRYNVRFLNSSIDYKESANVDLYSGFMAIKGSITNKQTSFTHFMQGNKPSAELLYPISNPSSNNPVCKTNHIINTGSDGVLNIAYLNYDKKPVGFKILVFTLELELLEPSENSYV
jgi:hypothetical protein